MLACILIVGGAFYWLGVETNWLRVNLVSRYDDSDIELDYDASDSIYLDDWQADIDTEIAYTKWLANLYAPKPHYMPFPEDDVLPQDKWMQVQDDLHARRNGEMLYQRGNTHVYA